VWRMVEDPDLGFHHAPVTTGLRWHGKAPLGDQTSVRTS